MRNFAPKALLCCALLLACLGGGAACGDDDKDDDAEAEEGTLDGDCEVIMEACHELDEGGGKPHDCHELAHENDTKVCTAEKDECLEACPAHEH